jgi:purine-binding chemotaxis protein CheW
MLNEPRLRERSGAMRGAGCAMEKTSQLVMFLLNGQRYALPLEIVERVTRAVEVTPLPEAPPVILGIINLQGEVVPVVDLQTRFRHPPREIRVTDHFIVAESAHGLVALPVDEAVGLLRDTSGEQVSATEVMPDLSYVSDVFLLGADMVFVLDIDTVLTDEEASAVADSVRVADRD